MEGTDAQLGRLADILGRKGAMLLALSLFGKIATSIMRRAHCRCEH